MQLDSTAPRSAADIPKLLASLATSSRPALTFYSDAGRVELSGKVLAQWAYKCANLLYEEGIGAGSSVRFDLDPSWRALPWALGTWLAGAGISFSSDGADVAVTDRPDSHHEPLVVALPADPLALEYGPSLPVGVLDGAADAAMQADLPLAPAHGHEEQLALLDDDVTFAELFQSLQGGAGGRMLIEPINLENLIKTCAATWLAGGTAVVSTDSSQRAAVIAQEGIAH